MRIGDADRRRTQRRLRSGYLRGELSDDTFERRLELSFHARATGDLAALTADIPRALDRVRARLRRLNGASRPDGPELVAPAAAPGDAVVVGRGSACDLRVLEPSVSRRHAELRRTQDGWLLVDWASTNGTWVNGVRIERAYVADGDEIKLGAARLVLRAP